ncbi:hypothetical protein LAZ67_5003743 [Cordylochernes scorpioides]|uniref:Uncharacterized protein n=1 Tax=Cordylochernes scorpioides TaxID=51811 RepID=A0ABY6KJC4_9ARAC|nr:hypothetical protein LAZ67_5003743 [Cordylochernes scorpioides]
MPKAQNRLRSIECEMASLREHRVWDVDLPGGVKRRPNQDLDHSGPPMRIYKDLISALQLVEKLGRYPLRNKRKIDYVEPEETSMNVKTEAST